MTFAIVAIALTLDALLGWPDALYQRIGHPVTWLGRLISMLEARWNQGGNRFAKGMAASLIVIAAAFLVGLLLQSVLGTLVAGVLAWPLVATRSLYDHVNAVARPLATGDLPAARHATSMIVGRDVSQADAPALARASVESLAENASDGVVAPLFWAAIGGLPGIAAYKAINTLDSMIGHRNDRYEQFGKFAARLDDVANWAPARLTAILFALASHHAPAAWRTARRDAGKHRSPNAGWPEAAMAGALNIRLSGPRVYGDRTADEPWLNAGAPDPTARDITRALNLYRRAVAIGGAAVILLALLLS